MGDEEQEVGISDVQVYLPALRVSAEDLAKARGTDTAHYTDGFGVKTFAIPNVDEDIATMGANAAIKVVERNKIDPHSVNLRCATESALDDSKPFITYVMEPLEIRFGKAFCFSIPAETKFACVGGMKEVKDALYAAKAVGEKSLIVTSDHAKYDLNSNCEPTSGAGGSAILVEPDPKLLAVDLRTIKFFTMPEYDFYKPKFKANQAGLKESVRNHMGEVGGVIYGKDTPFVNGKYSEMAYEFVIYNVYAQIEKEIGKSVFEEVDQIAVHTPSVKVAKKAFADILVHHLKRKNGDEWKEMMKAVKQITSLENQKDGKKPVIAKEPLLNGLKTFHDSLDVILTFAKVKEALERDKKSVLSGDAKETQSIVHNLIKLNDKLGKSHPELWVLTAWHFTANKSDALNVLKPLEAEINQFINERKAFVSAIMKTSQYKEASMKKAVSSHKISSYAGNGYTSSVMFSTVSMLTEEQKAGKDLVGKKVLVIGYGSGAGGVGFIGTVKEGIRDYAASTDTSFTEKGTNISVKMYEELHRGELKVPVPENENKDKVVTLGAIFRDGKRSYNVKARQIA